MVLTRTDLETPSGCYNVLHLMRFAVQNQMFWADRERMRISRNAYCSGYVQHSPFKAQDHLKYFYLDYCHGRPRRASALFL